MFHLIWWWIFSHSFINRKTYDVSAWEKRELVYSTAIPLICDSDNISGGLYLTQEGINKRKLRVFWFWSVVQLFDIFVSYIFLTLIGKFLSTSMNIKTHKDAARKKIIVFISYQLLTRQIIEFWAIKSVCVVHCFSCSNCVNNRTKSRLPGACRHYSVGKI